MTESIRERVHAAIQETNDAQDDLDGAVLTGWVTVCEWMDPDGDRWISFLSGTDGGEKTPPPWTIRGYLHEALFHWKHSND